MQVFISHAQADEKIARELRAQLAEAGVKVWLADEEVLLGENLSLEVGKALERSEAMVVLLSPAAIESKNVCSEIAYAFASPRFEGRLLPVVVKPTKDIPWFLKTLDLIQARSAQTHAVKQVAEKIVAALAHDPARGELVAEHSQV